MKIIVSETYEASCGQAADDLMELAGSLSRPLVCTASGDSPAGLYRELVRRTQIHPDTVSSWLFVGLDEWSGMNGRDEGSCRYYLDQQLFGPLHIDESRICFFDGRSDHPETECTRTEEFIGNHRGIDIAILGLGMNGHIGMNEPGTPAGSRSHVAEIAPLTQQVGQKYFPAQRKLEQGLTLGLGTLMEARHILLLVNGEHKARIAQRIIEEPISEQLPASLLREHPGLTIYLDRAAAQFLSSHA